MFTYCLEILPVPATATVREGAPDQLPESTRVPVVAVLLALNRIGSVDEAVSVIVASSGGRTASGLGLGGTAPLVLRHVLATDASRHTSQPTCQLPLTAQSSPAELRAQTITLPLRLMASPRARLRSLITRPSAEF